LVRRTRRKKGILCGSVFNSPQLLMLSGIGDPNQLGKHGIK
jgi:choline dehydrogenase-like flavoprotein